MRFGKKKGGMAGGKKTGMEEVIGAEGGPHLAKEVKSSAQEKPQSTCLRNQTKIFQTSKKKRKTGKGKVKKKLKIGCTA